jgi:hypothetical protein
MLIVPVSVQVYALILQVRNGLTTVDYFMKHTNLMCVHLRLGVE